MKPLDVDHTVLVL